MIEKKAVRLASLGIALLLTAGGLYLAVAGGHNALDYFTALSDSRQRMLSCGMAVFSIVVLSLGGFLRRRRAGHDDA